MSTRRDPEATRAAILEAAEEAFLQKGVADASTSLIARRAGVTGYIGPIRPAMPRVSRLAARGRIALRVGGASMADSAAGDRGRSTTGHSTRAPAAGERGRPRKVMP